VDVVWAVKRSMVGCMIETIQTIDGKSKTYQTDPNLIVKIRFTCSYFIRDPQKGVQYLTPSKGWFCPPFCPHLRGHGRLDLNPRGNDFWYTLLVGSFYLGPTYKFVSIWWGHVFVCHLSIGLACRGRVSACKAIS
jgi:hypothetical protein